MPGFDLDYSKFDELLPFELKYSVNSNNLSSKGNFKLLEKSTSREILEFDRAYANYGKYAFSQFKKDGRWYAFVGTQYNNAKLIDLADGSEIAILDRDETGGHFCPTGFYVPGFHIDRKSYYTSKERKYKKVGNSYIYDNSPEFEEHNVEIHVIPEHENYMVTADHEFEEMENFSWDHVEFTNTAFMCGVWWAADYEWLVHKIDIDETFRTGKFSPTTEKSYLFDFDYSAQPEVRQYIKTDMQSVESINSLDRKKLRYYSYQMKFVDGKEVS